MSIILKQFMCSFCLFFSQYKECTLYIYIYIQPRLKLYVWICKHYPHFSLQIARFKVSFTSSCEKFGQKGAFARLMLKELVSYIFMDMELFLLWNDDNRAIFFFSLPLLLIHLFLSLLCLFICWLFFSFWFWFCQWTRFFSFFCFVCLCVHVSSMGFWFCHAVVSDEDLFSVSKNVSLGKIGFVPVVNTSLCLSHSLSLVLRWPCVLMGH